MKTFPVALIDLDTTDLVGSAIACFTLCWVLGFGETTDTFLHFSYVDV